MRIKFESNNLLIKKYIQSYSILEDYPRDVAFDTRNCQRGI